MSLVTSCECASIDVGQKKKVTPPGNVVYSNDFLYLWNKLVAKEDEDELSIVILRFLERIVRMVQEVQDDKIREITPPKQEYCCSLCGPEPSSKGPYACHTTSPNRPARRK